MQKTIILLLSLSLFSSAEKRTDTFYSTTYHACLKGVSNPDKCIEDELTFQDKKLNLAYQKARKAIQPFRREALKEVQRVWIRYRDKKCHFFYHKESGSGGLSDALACELEETMRRAKELEALY